MAVIRWNPTEGQMLCRDLRHAWEPYTVQVIRARRKKFYERTLRCMRCSSFKEQLLADDGLVLRTRMRYSSGYLVPKGHGRLTQADCAWLRVESLEHEYVEDE